MYMSFFDRYKMKFYIKIHFKKGVINENIEIHWNIKKKISGSVLNIAHYPIKSEVKKWKSKKIIKSRQCGKIPKAK